MKIDKRHLLNYSILLPYLILSVIGLIMVYSTTSVSLIQAHANPFKSVINQGVFWIISLVAITFIYKLKLNFLTNTRVLTVVMLERPFFNYCPLLYNCYQRSAWLDCDRTSQLSAC